jgi:hypothetical protein
LKACNSIFTTFVILNIDNQFICPPYCGSANYNFVGPPLTDTDTDTDTYTDKGKIGRGH